MHKWFSAYHFLESRSVNSVRNSSCRLFFKEYSSSVDAPITSTYLIRKMTLAFSWILVAVTALITGTHFILLPVLALYLRVMCIGNHFQSLASKISQTIIVSEMLFPICCCQLPEIVAQINLSLSSGLVHEQRANSVSITTDYVDGFTSSSKAVLC